MQNFTNKVAVVTGGASGIGRALAQRCLQEGMQVVLADIEEEALFKAADEMQSGGKNNVLPIRMDVSELSEVEDLARRTLDTFGAVHLLFNNAGVAGSGRVLDSSINDWQWVIGVNLWSVIYGLKTFVPIMLKQDSNCHVVNTASVAGLIGASGATPGYSVTKHGVVVLTESLHFELLEKNARVKISVLCPGFVQTEIMESNRNRQARFQDSNDVEVSAEEIEARDMFREFVRTGMPPDELASIVFQGIRDEQLYILTHSDFNENILTRANNITKGINPAPLAL